MADTINIILEYLHRHHFTKAEVVLREEINARQRGNGPLTLPLNDDLDVDISIYLKSMQEKAAEQQHILDATPEKRALDTEKKSGTEVKPSAQQLKLGSEVKEKVHGQVDKLRPIVKLEEPAPLFMEFDVEELEHPTKPVLSVRTSPPSGILSPVSKNILPEKSPARVGGLGVLQTDAEVAASSSYEMVASDLKVELTTIVTGKSSEGNTGGGLNPQSYLERECPPTQEIDSPQALLEVTRGKVDALKQVGCPRRRKYLQRWEPKTTDKPALVHEKGQAVSTKKVEAQSDKGNDNNGPLTPVQASARSPLTPGFADEMDSTSHGDTGSPETLLKGMIGEENGPGISLTVLKTLEWTDVPIKTIPPIKTSVSLTTESRKKSEGGGREVGSTLSRHAQGSGSEVECMQTGLKQELASQVSFERERGSQNAGVPLDEGEKNPAGQLRGEETTSQMLDTESMLLAPDLAQEELPKLPPVRLRSNESKIPEGPRDGVSGGIRKGPDDMAPVNVSGAVEATPFGLGSYLDIPVGQDISSSGSRRMSATARPSVSHGITEDQSELLSGFATAGDGQSESAVDYPDEYWDSDTYEDDDDPGYHRQPIEDEEWFLSHEIDYPSEDERARPNVENPRGVRHEKDYEKYDDEDCSFVEEEVSNAGRIFDQGEYDRQLLNVEGLALMGGETRWQGFDASKGTLSEEGGVMVAGRERGPPDDNTFEVEDGRVGSVRFGGVGVSSDVAEFGSERRESVHGESSEGDLEIGEIGIRSIGQTSSSSQVANSDSGKLLESETLWNQDDDDEEEDRILRFRNNPWASHKRRGVEREASSVDILHFQNQENEKSIITKLGSNGDVEGRVYKETDIGGGTGFGGFSFPSPSTSGGDIAAVSRVDSGKSLWSVRDITSQVLGEGGEEYGNGLLGPDDPLASWRRKSNESSPIISPRNEALRDSSLSVRSPGSANSMDGYGSGAAKDDKEGDDEDNEVEEEVEEEDLLEVDQQIREAEAVAAEDEEAAAVQEQIRRIRAEEDEFETFDLKIVHRKNRTGFEEDKDFPVVINAVIAGRYHVTEYLGSAAFSKAIQAHDLHTGMDVCMKIIKNNKDFFDQSLDEIKLLKYINKHDPGDKHHVLRLYDYFYHREHLFIVCELLRANLYEFHKYNRESGGEVYFTMPRLQSITRQCLEALEFIHGLGLIHCDLKPENILVKSYSRCEVKVIDLGSSCFQTDHLCSYVQSRSYRAPEVILGLPYDQKIDIWSLGCILAELCSGNVLFQNDSLATLLARVVGILGPIDPELLAKGRDTHKFFTKNHLLYERNQDSDQLEYLLPKKTSLAHRLPMGDHGFVDFVGYLLQINPSTRPSANEALKHPWLSHPYEPISS